MCGCVVESVHGVGRLDPAQDRKGGKIRNPCAHTCAYRSRHTHMHILTRQHHTKNTKHIEGDSLVLDQDTNYGSCISHTTWLHTHTHTLASTTHTNTRAHTHTNTCAHTHNLCPSQEFWDTVIDKAFAAAINQVSVRTRVGAHVCVRVLAGIICSRLHAGVHAYTGMCPAQ